MIVFSRNYLSRDDAIERARYLKTMMDNPVKVLYDGDCTGLDGTFIEHRHEWGDMMLREMTGDDVFFIEYDGLPIVKGLDSRSIGYMDENGIDLLTQKLVTVTENDMDLPQGIRHPFIGKGCRPGDLFCGLACFCIRKDALEWWIKNWTFHDPKFWMEIDLPNILSKNGYNVAESPFLENETFRWRSDKRDLNDDEISLAWRCGYFAVHPVKKLENYIRNESKA